MTPTNNHIPRRNPSCAGIGCGILATAGAVILIIGVTAAVTTHPTPHPTTVTVTTSLGPVASTRPGPPPTSSTTCR